MSSPALAAGPAAAGGPAPGDVLPLPLVLANAVVFQLAWFACVLGGAHGLPWLGPLAVAAMAAWHLGWVARPDPELRLVAAALALGLVFDALLLASGAIRFPSGHWLPGLSPYWMQALWVLFALTLNVSLRWLKGRLLLAAALGAVSGPLSFWGGARLGAATLVDRPLALGLLAVGWGLAMPLLVGAATRWNGVAARRAAAAGAAR
ncbi:DUF2878 domain-containing protein [Piscinibacter sakaiensis]|uniref:DUF2878 domain-containing protein n=1 Tax=Piscinibacter sakaiensis TaxID=1547922 RepID=UPI0009EBBF62|nr:DUF2878 domain-containing protein [Piscinibacter sakaiensis]